MMYADIRRKLEAQARENQRAARQMVRALSGKQGALKPEPDDLSEQFTSYNDTAVVRKRTP